MKQAKLKTEIATQVRTQWSGPIPAPESLAKYEQIVAGSAERILVMAEEEQKHRHRLEDKEGKRRYVVSLISMIFAFLCVLSLIGLVIYTISVGSYGKTLATTIAAIATVAGIFGIGKFMRSKEK